MVLPRLYRGVTEPLPLGGLHAFVREDRRPRDTGNRVAFNICFNLMVERHFGVPLIRRRSLFVCGDISKVLQYAGARDAQHIGIVEPISFFRFLYASDVGDSAALAADLTQRYQDCFHSWQRPICRPLLEDTHLTLSKLEAFLLEHPEVDQGGFSWGKSSLRDRLYKMLDDLRIPNYRRTYSYTDCDLSAGALAGVEVLIFDCPHGYRITPVEPSELPVAVPARLVVSVDGTAKRDHV